MQRSKQKIASLRKFYGGLIGTTDNHQETYENLFMPGATINPKFKNDPKLSLSVYNGTASLARPKTAAVNILKGVKGLEPEPVDEEGNPLPQAPVDTRIAEMQVPEGLKMLARTNTEQHRMEQMMECVQIKDRLAREGCAVPITVLARAIMMPEDCEWYPQVRQYPHAGEGLMVNPDPKPKKKKKGKKKKK